MTFTQEDIDKNRIPGFKREVLEHCQQDIHGVYHIDKDKFLKVINGIGIENPPEPTPDPIPAVIEPPLWVKIVSKKRIPTDKGVGDTLERIFRHVGAEKMTKLWTKYTGIKCNCKDRKEWCNTHYPYK